MSKLCSIVVFLLVANYALALNRYVYKFGQDYGQIVVKQEDTIPLLHPVSDISLQIPPGVQVTYVEVAVYAISPPKVDWNGDTNTVSIMYDWTQISYSKYSILAKGVNYDQRRAVGVAQ